VSHKPQHAIIAGYFASHTRHSSESRTLPAGARRCAARSRQVRKIGRMRSSYGDLSKSSTTQTSECVAQANAHGQRFPCPPQNETANSLRFTQGPALVSAANSGAKRTRGSSRVVLWKCTNIDYINATILNRPCAVRGFVRTHFLPFTRSDRESRTTLHLLNLWNKQSWIRSILFAILTSISSFCLSSQHYNATEERFLLALVDEILCFCFLRKLQERLTAAQQRSPSRLLLTWSVFVYPFHDQTCFAVVHDSVTTSTLLIVMNCSSYMGAVDK
jgi:hypothetical protein